MILITVVLLNLQSAATTSTSSPVQSGKPLAAANQPAAPSQKKPLDNNHSRATPAPTEEGLDEGGELHKPIDGVIAPRASGGPIKTVTPGKNLDPKINRHPEANKSPTPSNLPSLPKR